MSVVSPRARAAQTKRNQSRGALLGVAEQLFEEFPYKHIQYRDISESATVAHQTFYNIFATKSAWAVTVLSARLDEALDLQALCEQGTSLSIDEQLLGKLCLFERVSDDLPGITIGLIEERTRSDTSNHRLLPGFYCEIAEDLEIGTKTGDFRGGTNSPETVNFIIDSLAMACAAQNIGAPYMILDSLVK